MSAYQHLTLSQLRELRIDLEHELAWLDRATTNHIAENPGAYTRFDAEDPTGHGGLSVALHGHARTRHAEVADALERMISGDYGNCMRCGSAIPHSRLQFMPETAHCINCGITS